MSQPPKTPPPGQAKAIPKALQDAAEEFYMWIGYCITGWADTEAEVFRICWKALGCTEQKTAIVYYKSPTLESRITLTSELVLNLLPKTENGQAKHADLKFWNGIISAFDDLKQTRNRIAHHPVAPKMSVQGTLGHPDAAVATYWYENYVSPEESLRGRPEKGPLRVADLKKHHIAVLGLKSDLEEFLHQRLPTYF